MNKIAYIAIFFIFLSACSDKEDISQFGSIYGNIIDKGTGKPVMVAYVTLFNENDVIVDKPQPTNDLGYYEFINLKSGSYTLQIKKTEYIDIVGNPIILDFGEKKRRDFIIEKPPIFLRIINGKGEDINTLDFGKDNDSRLFQILNFGTVSLDWSIGKDHDWITMITPQKGTLAINNPQPITIEIDRNKLDAGQNTGKITIVSNNGNKVLEITALGKYIEPKVKILPLSSYYSSGSSPVSLDTFNGEIINTGNPSYFKRGFCYSSLNERPTINDNPIEEIATGLGKYKIWNKDHDLPWHHLSYVNPHSTTFYIRAWVAYRDEMNNVKTTYSDNIESVTVPGYLD